MIFGADGTLTVDLDRGWELLRSDPGEYQHPSELPATGWRLGLARGTVASLVGPTDPFAHPDYDASDWWYRIEVRLNQPVPPPPAAILRLEGLASLAEVWIDGKSVLRSKNMFRSHDLPLPPSDDGHYALVMVFRSLKKALESRHPRPRWKTALVREQELRWYRTTLLGRIPGWTPPIPPVGPWRPVTVDIAGSLPTIHDVRLRPSVSRDLAASLEVSARARGVPSGATFTLLAGGTQVPLEVTERDGGAELYVVTDLDHVPLWFPHDLGRPATVPLTLQVNRGEESHNLELGSVGFRRVDLDSDHGQVRLIVNGIPTFCRGACWTPPDLESLEPSEHEMRETLVRLRDAGANMVRVGGTMVYECERFYTLCNELGLMVWQDFMFANMDYPTQDQEFRTEVETEARQQARRLAKHPSVCVWCGGSEIQQQASMFGATADQWADEWFNRWLPDLLADCAPHTPYWPSTPTGGALPFHTDEGLSHYYGVGAYLRPLEDVQRAGVRFTPETLGFANVPEPDALWQLSEDGPVPPHHPLWKRGVPRDSGAGWDFDDVRDHYLERLFGEDPTLLRYQDLERYWTLSRVTSGFLMERVYREWRRGESGCHGALVWFLRDLVPGAGWGIMDSSGSPKAPYYYLKRAWAPLTVSLLDRGLNGHEVSIVNDGGTAVSGTLLIRIFDRGSIVIAEASTEVHVGGRESVTLRVDGILGRFLDTTYSYRFGPPKHEAVVAELIDQDDRVSAYDVFRVDYRRAIESSPSGEVVRRDDGSLEVSLRASHLTYDTQVRIRDHLAEDNYVTLVPDRTRTLIFRPIIESPRSFRGSVEALNMSTPLRLDLESA